MIQELDLTEEPLAQLAEFDVKGLIKEVRGEFVQRKRERNCPSLPDKWPTSTSYARRNSAWKS